MVWYSPEARFDVYENEYGDKIPVRANKQSTGRVAIRALGYMAADSVVSPIVDNCAKTAPVKIIASKLSPETKQLTGDMIKIVSASAVLKAAEAAYDQQYNNKPYEESAQEFALNAGIHAANEAVYYYAVKPLVQEVVSPDLEPVAEFAAGLTTTYLLLEGLKLVLGK